MKRGVAVSHGRRQGSALLLSLLAIAMFSTRAAALATLSGTGVQIARNHRQLDITRACAESGMEVLRYWMSKVEISGMTDEEQRFSTLATTLQNELSAAASTNITSVYSGSTITISNVPLHSSSNQSFSATLTKIDNSNVQLDVTGHYGTLHRTIRSSYQYDENRRIPSNRNPGFSGQTILRGVIYLQTPNVVSFSGGVNVTAIIVTNGDPSDNSGTNRLTFSGNVTGHPINQLPQQPQFAGLHSKTGTFILAPGFHLGFGGSFDALCGAITGNGIEFWGSAGGTINGSIINYSNAPLTLRGNADLPFNRSGLTEIPAGFVPTTILQCNAASCSEPLL